MTPLLFGMNEKNSTVHGYSRKEPLLISRDFLHLISPFCHSPPSSSLLSSYIFLGAQIITIFFLFLLFIDDDDDDDDDGRWY